MRLLCVLAIGLGMATATGPVQACPFCPKVSVTLGEQISRAETVVLVEWVEADRGNDDTESPRTIFSIVQTVKSPPAAGSVQPGTDKADADKPGADKPVGDTTAGGKDAATAESSTSARKRIVYPRFRAGEPGDLFLLSGTFSEGQLQWEDPQEVSETAFQYVLQAPPRESNIDKRLRYFLKFLEFPDPFIADDAFAEFASAPYAAVARLAPVLQRKRLVAWIRDPATPPTHLGLYGMMLGLCGTAEDAAFLKTIIVDETEDFRLGVDGLIGGYLLLTGKDGLRVINETKLQNRDAPFSEVYAAMQALRFMWTYGGQDVDRDALKASLRTLLDRPELADLVIADLARWRDWTLQDRLMELYGQDDYDTPAVRRAIASYMIASTRDLPVELQSKPPRHVVRGRQALETIEKKDPRTLEQVERYFRPGG